MAPLSPQETEAGTGSTRGRRDPKVPVRWCAAWATLIAFGAAGCTSQKTQPDVGHGGAEFRVTVAALSSEDVDRILVRVTGPGIASPLTFEANFNESAGVFSGRLENIPAGEDRNFDIELFDVDGGIIFTGSQPSVTITRNADAFIQTVVQEVSAPAFVNFAPSIFGIVATRRRISPQDGVRIRASATAGDQDADDTLTVAWSGSGSFQPNNALLTEWTAPDTPGLHPLTLRVTDQSGSFAELTFTMQVLGGGPLLITSLASDRTFVGQSESVALDLTVAPPVPTSLGFQWTASCPGAFDDDQKEDPRFTPAASFLAFCDLSVDATDGLGQRATHSIRISKWSIEATPPTARVLDDFDNRDTTNEVVFFGVDQDGEYKTGDGRSGSSIRLETFDPFASSWGIGVSKVYSNDEGTTALNASGFSQLSAWVFSEQDDDARTLHFELDVDRGDDAPVTLEEAPRRSINGFFNTWTKITAPLDRQRFAGLRPSDLENIVGVKLLLLRNGVSSEAVTVRIDDLRLEPACATDNHCFVASDHCSAGQCVPNHLEVLELGNRTLNNSTETATSLSVPANVQSFQITATTPLRSPSVTTFVNSLSAPGDRDLTISAATKDRFSFLFPPAPSFTLEAGTYRIGLANNQDADTRYGLHGILKTGAVDTGILDLNIIFVGVPNISAQTAWSDNTFQSVLRQVGDHFEAVGITLGEVRSFDANEADGQQFGVIDSVEGKDNEFSMLVQTASRYVDRNGLNVFLVRSFADNDDDDDISLIGKSDGTPGPVMLPTKRSSGVVVSAEDYKNTPDALARLISHEVGHYLGLVHTSESDGESHDPLSDTPECGADQDEDGDKTLSAEECGNLGADNLMFWIDDSRIRNFTEEQGFVMRRHATLR